jgi:hypothetical protein
MHATPLQCPTCRKAAQLIVDEFTAGPAGSSAGSASRRRRFMLTCPSGCTPSRSQLERLADPMAC